MKKVRVTGFCATLGSGKIELTPEQAGPRVNAGTIAATKKDGVFEVVGQVQFKRGEVFGYDGEFPPSLLEDMSPVKDAVQKEADEEAEAQAIKDARIAELEALGEAITEDESAELDALLSE